jgi:hypothetical protein
VHTFDPESVNADKKDEDVEPDEQVAAVREKIRTIWQKPIYLYSQTELELLIMFLSQFINEVRARVCVCERLLMCF